MRLLGSVSVLVGLETFLLYSIGNQLHLQKEDRDRNNIANSIVIACILLGGIIFTLVKAAFRVF